MPESSSPVSSPAYMDNEPTRYGILESILQDPSAKPRALRLQELKEVTNNFSKDRQLGKGGFGIVYKGLLPNGEAVAVKDLIMSHFQGKQFKHEVDNLMKVQHKNIVRFLGYCYESSHQYIEYEATHVFAESSKMLLCFEYVPNGSLDKHINDESCGFDWYKRYTIIKGICHGVHYLHEECQPHGSILHLDLKPENILLDDSMVPKIADFGISKLFSDQKLETRATFAIGSLGYMAPEYISGNIVSKKADMYSLGVIIMQIITGRRVDVTSCENIVEPVLENWSKRMEAKTSKTDCEQIRMCLKIGIQCLEFVKENRPSTKEILQILYTWEEINNGYASDKETYKLMRDKESHCNKIKETTIVEIAVERILMGDADDDQNGFSDEEMRQSVNEKQLGGATEKEELSETAREETAEETAARVGGMVPAALDAVRAAARFPGRWKAIAANLEKLRACLQNPCSHHPCQLETYNNSLCREVLQSVADTLAEVTDLAGRCTEDLWKKVKPSTVDGVAVKLDVSLRDCELLVKIGELYEDTSSLPALDDTSTCVDVREVQRLLAWLEMSHTEAKILALDGLLEALHKDEKRVVSMLHIDNVSAMVQPLTASWPEVIRQKAATVVCHVAGSEDGWRLLESEVALPPLISLAKSYSQVSRQKAVVTLHHLSSASRSTARAIVSHCGVGPLTKMCSDKWCDPVSHSAAAGTLKNIFTAMDFRHSVDNHGIVGVMVDLLDRAEVAPESKEHAAECLKDFTSRDDDDGLRRAVVSEGGLRALLLYHLGDTDDRHETVVSAIRSLVGVISTTSGSADDATRRMKRLVGEQGCVPLLVRMIQEVGNSNSAREVAVEMLASLATYPLNATTMSEDDKCVPALVQLLVESAGSPICRHKAVVLLHIVSSKSHSSGWVIASLGGIDPLIQMCRHKRIDSMSQSAAAGTLKNISEVPDLRQSLAKHGIVSVMVDLLDCGDAVLASKDHAAECLMNLTSSRANDGGLQRDIVSEGGLRALLLYLGDTDQDRLQPHRVAVSAIRNLVGVISTTSGLADDDDTATTMKRVAGEQGCVPLLVRTMQDGASYTAREVAVHALASLATYPPNAREMDVDDKCVPALVQLLNLIPDSTITAIMDAVQCLLLLESTKRWRKLMISHGAKRYLKKLTDMDVQGATELLQRLERGSLRSLFSGSKQ